MKLSISRTDMNKEYTIEVIPCPEPWVVKPTPPVGQLSQRISILRATMFRLKHDVRSVSTNTEESSPMMDHGSMFDGVWRPPASNPAAYMQALFMHKIQVQHMTEAS
jgi:hypothetical protein